jgi:hypothetical protein
MGTAPLVNLEFAEVCTRHLFRYQQDLGQRTRGVRILENFADSRRDQSGDPDPCVRRGAMCRRPREVLIGNPRGAPTSGARAARFGTSPADIDEAR